VIRVGRPGLTLESKPVYFAVDLETTRKLLNFNWYGIVTHLSPNNSENPE
jgi:hypothetical protein